MIGHVYCEKCGKITGLLAPTEEAGECTCEEALTLTAEDVWSLYHKIVTVTAQSAEHWMQLPPLNDLKKELKEAYIALHLYEKGKP